MQTETEEREHTQMAEEYFDIYNDKKEKTGRTMKRKGSFLKEGEFCLIVLGIVQKRDGRFLITRRAMDKHWAPGAWEVPGGGVRAGEESADAVLREVREETGLAFAPEDARLIDSYYNIDLARGDNYFVDIYHICADFDETAVIIDSHEATEYALAPFEKLTELEEAGAFMHYARIKTALSKAGLL